MGIRRAGHATPLYPQNLALNFVDKWRSLRRYISLAKQETSNKQFLSLLLLELAMSFSK
jgi:hypothetical protein